jgi:hypothetical protein
VHFFKKHGNYWESKNLQDKNRSIASYKDKLELEAYRHYFVTNSFNKYLHFKITTNYRSSINTKEVDDILKKSFLGSFKHKDASIPLFGFFKKNLLERSINNFVNSLSENNIKNGKFVIDLLFTPEFEQELHYKKELSSNKLIHVDDFSLKSDIFEKRLSQVEKVMSTPIPFTKEKYQYSGGAITINLNAIDLEKNIFDGQVRYRRYFRANNLSTADLDIENKDFKLNYFKLKKLTKKYDNFITVDLFKKFGNTSDGPKRSHLDITFGKLLSTVQDEDTKQTGKFYINGHFPINDKKTETKVKLDKLSYSFDTKSFTEDSKFFVNFRGPEAINRDKEKFFVKKILREHLASQMVIQLKLDHFHSEITKAGESK